MRIKRENPVVVGYIGNSDKKLSCMFDSAGWHKDMAAVGDDVAGELFSKARGDMRFYPDPTLAAFVCAHYHASDPGVNLFRANLSV